MAVGRLYKSTVLIRGEDSASSTPFLVVPIDHLQVSPIPFTGVGDTAVELFDGRFVFRQPQFQFNISFNWDYLTDKEANVLNRVIRHVLGIEVAADVTGNLQPATTETVAGASQGITRIFFDTQDLTKNLQVVPRLADENISLSLNKRTRRKPASIDFVTVTPTTNPPPTWLIED